MIVYATAPLCSWFFHSLSLSFARTCSSCMAYRWNAARKKINLSILHWTIKASKETETGEKERKTKPFMEKKNTEGVDIAIWMRHTSACSISECTWECDETRSKSECLRLRTNDRRQRQRQRTNGRIYNWENFIRVFGLR